VRTLADGAEDEWIAARRWRYYDAIKARGIDVSPEHYFFHVGFAHFEKWWISRRAIAPRDHETPLRLLELGSFEGGSSMWLAEHVLRHAGDQLLCVDLWRRHKGQEKLQYLTEQDLEYRTDFTTPAIDSAGAKFRANMQQTPFGERASSVASTTLSALAALLGDELEIEAFDFVYVDAGHRGPDVLADGSLAFRLLRVGGVMAFDDYDVTRSPPSGCRRGIDAVLHAHEGAFEVLAAPAYQHWIRKSQLVTALE